MLTLVEFLTRSCRHPHRRATVPLHRCAPDADNSSLPNNMSFTVPNKRGCPQKTREVHVEDARPRQQHQYQQRQPLHYMGDQDRHWQLRPQHTRFALSQDGMLGQSPNRPAVQPSRFQVRPLDLGRRANHIVGSHVYGGSTSAASFDVDSLPSPVQTGSSGTDLDVTDSAAMLLPMDEVRVEPSRKVSETHEVAGRRCCYCCCYCCC